MEAARRISVALVYYIIIHICVSHYSGSGSVSSLFNEHATISTFEYGILVFPNNDIPQYRTKGNYLYYRIPQCENEDLHSRIQRLASLAFHDSLIAS